MEGPISEKQGPTRLVVFLTLAISFLTAFAAAGSIFFQAALEAKRNETANHLRVVAQLLADRIDPASVAALQSPDQADSEPFKIQTKVLKQVVAADKSITHAAVLKEVGPTYCFLADASSLGDQKSKSNLLDPDGFVPNGLIQSVADKVAVADTSLVEDRWGTWYSAFAPVVDESGAVVAAVQVDSDSALVESSIQAGLSGFKWIAAAIAAALVGLAWIVSLSVQRGLAQPQAQTVAAKAKRFAQFLLLAAVLGIGVEAVRILHRQENLRTIQESAANWEIARDATRQAYSDAVAGKQISDEELQTLKSALGGINQATVFDDFAQFNGRNDRSAGSAQMQSQIGRMDRQLAEFSSEQSQIMDDQNAAQFRLLLGIAALSLIAIGLSQNAANLDRRVRETVSDSNNLQAQLSSLVENLPVGMFVLRNGEVTFANAEWRFQTGANESAPTLQTLAQCIHPDDRDETIRVISESSRTATPFQTAYRIRTQRGPALHVETRGVPVYDPDGVCRQMIAFTVDLTATVEATNAMESAFEEVANKNRLLGDAMAELERNLENVVRALVKAVEAKDPYTAGHSERVMQYSVWLGEAIGLGPYELRILELGTLVHDVGKIGIPDAILTKPDRLTEEEYAIIKKHPEYGVNIIGNIDLFRECLPIVRWHHERLDGKGYPDGLKGDEIPLLVRISAIADIFDAMTSTRAYRRGMDLEKVLEIMNSVSEKGEIDSNLFATFCQVIHKKGIIPQQLQQEPWKAA